MSFREIDKNGNGQGKDDGCVDFTKQLAKQQEANKPATDKDGYSSKIFGMRFGKDMNGDSAEITGAYDPEQGLWSTRDDRTDRTYQRHTTKSGEDTVVNFD